MKSVIRALVMFAAAGAVAFLLGCSKQAKQSSRVFVEEMNDLDTIYIEIEKFIQSNGTPPRSIKELKITNVTKSDYIYTPDDSDIWLAGAKPFVVSDGTTYRTICKRDGFRSMIPETDFQKRAK